MSYYEGDFDWDEYFDEEAMYYESIDVDMYLGELAMQGDVGGVEDGMGSVISDADPGL